MQIKNINEAIYDKDLNSSEYRLLCFYVSESEIKPIVDYSIKDIADKLNMSYSTINRANNKLIKKEYISKKRRYSNSNIITILNKEANNG